MGTAASFNNKSKSWLKKNDITPHHGKNSSPKIPGIASKESFPAPEMPLRVKTRRSTEIFEVLAGEPPASPSHSLAIKTAKEFDPKAGAKVVNHIVNAGFVFLEPGARVRRVGLFLDEAELAHQSAQEKSVRRHRRQSTEISESMVGVFLF